MKNTKIFKKGFTLLELLVVVAIIGLLTTVVIAALNNARNKGGDAGVKTNLKNAIPQGEIYYGTNTAYPNSYTNVCSLGSVGGVAAIGSFVQAAAKANGYTYTATVGTDKRVVGSTAKATCNEMAIGWAAEVPLKSVSGQVWCVDNTGKAIQTSNVFSSSLDVICN